MAVEVLDEGIIKVPNPTGDVYILAATARGCAKSVRLALIAAT